MPTRSESFAGLSVALVTPLRQGKVDFDALQKQVEFQVQAGTTCVCPVGTTGEIAHLVARGARTGDFGRGRGGGGADQGYARHGVEQHGRRWPTLGCQLPPMRCWSSVPTTTSRWRGLHQHFKALAEVVDSDPHLQHPQAHGQEHRAWEIIIRLAEILNITMVKRSDRIDGSGRRRCCAAPTRQCLAATTA